MGGGRRLRGMSRDELKRVYVCERAGGCMRGCVRAGVCARAGVCVCPEGRHGFGRPPTGGG